MPSTIEQVHREYKDLGLALYAVNIEENRTTVAGFVQKHNLVLPVLLDPEGDGHYVLNRIWKTSELDYRP